MAKETFLRIRIDEETVKVYHQLCKERASNVSAMTRKLINDWIDATLQDILCDIGFIYVSSEELARALPEVYNDLLGKLEAWAADPTNTASDEDVAAFKAGEYQVEILFDDNILYTAGRNAQEISNQPPWSKDKWSDFLEAAPKKWLLDIIK